MIGKAQILQLQNSMTQDGWRERLAFSGYNYTVKKVSPNEKQVEKQSMKERHL